MENPMSETPKAPPALPAWMGVLDSREHSQIFHARVYARDHLGAGAPGHGQFLLIAKLAQMLDQRETVGATKRPSE